MDVYKWHPFYWTILSFTYFFCLSCILTFIQVFFNRTLCSSVSLVWAFVMWLRLKIHLSLLNFTVACRRTIDSKVVLDSTQGHSVVQCMTVNIWLFVWKDFSDPCRNISDPILLGMFFLDPQVSDSCLSTVPFLV